MKSEVPWALGKLGRRGHLPGAVDWRSPAHNEGLNLQ